MATHSDRIDSIEDSAKQFIENDHFDADNISAKWKALLSRYSNLQTPMVTRRNKLYDSLQAQQIFRDVEDEEAWIREKEPVAVSTNRGRDLIGVQNLIKKHQVVLSEINNHENRINSVLNDAQSLVDSGHFAATEIKNRADCLTDHWNALKEKASRRRQDLDDSLQV